MILRSSILRHIRSRKCFNRQKKEVKISLPFLFDYSEDGIGGIIPVGPRRQRLPKNERMFRRCNPVGDKGGTGLLHFDPRVSKNGGEFRRGRPVAYYVYVRGGIGGIMPVGPRRQRLPKNEMMFRRCNPVAYYVYAREGSGGTGLIFKAYLWTLPLPSPPASFSTSETETRL